MTLKIWVCECGCGQPVKTRNRFVHGHNLGTGKRITIKCENCGEEVQRYPSELKKGTHHFCSKKCKDKWFKGRPLSPSNMLEPSLESNPNLCYILGVIESDGYVASGRGTAKIELGVKDKEFADAFASALKNIGLNPHVSFVQRPYATDYWLCRAHSASFYRWYASLNWTDKLVIGSKNRENAAAFLRGLIDGDGSVEHKDTRVRFCNTNTDLLELFQELATFLGFHFHKYKQKQHRKTNQDYYILQLRKKDEVRQFLHLCNPSISRKRWKK